MDRWKIAQLQDASYLLTIPSNQSLPPDITVGGVLPLSLRSCLSSSSPWSHGRSRSKPTIPIHHGADEFEGHAIDLEFWTTIDLRSHNTLLPSIGCWAGGNYDALPLRNGAGGGGGYCGAEEVGKW